ncbi:methyltransferase domain-containing protein [Streptomyces sp. ODS28]|uniref:methyltransferase domain-containing protein n=1 Tax=Streptomyces sp. ODS28 TaxID=3136688 RepID=UPI0031E868F1
MTATTEDLVAQATHELPPALFHGEDGRAVRPCTPPETTTRHLRMLDLAPGQRVLDIGLGSGYSAALTERITGPNGRVIAMEMNAELAERASVLFTENGLDVDVRVGDGMFGCPEEAPFDRILVGATPPHIPAAWLEQLRPGGVLLCGVRISPLPGAYAIARITVDEHSNPDQVEAHSGGYTPMTTDVKHTVDSYFEDGTFLSTLAPRSEAEHRALAHALTDQPHTEPSQVGGQEAFLHFKNWLIAEEPDGLMEASTRHGPGIGLGHLDETGAAAAYVTPDLLVTDHERSESARTLRDLVDHWHSQGAPETSSLCAALNRYDEAWRISVTR